MAIDQVTSLIVPPTELASRCCLDHFTKVNVKPLIRELRAILKSGVGVQTKCGAANFLTSIASLKSEVVADHAPSVLEAIGNALGDRSAATRRALASAAAHVARISAVGMAKFIEVFVGKYGDGSDGEAAEHVALVLEELTLHAQDALKPHLEQVLPIAFVAKNAEAKVIAVCMCCLLFSCLCSMCMTDIVLPVLS